MLKIYLDKLWENLIDEGIVSGLPGEAHEIRPADSPSAKEFIDIHKLINKGKTEKEIIEELNLEIK